MMTLHHGDCLEVMRGMAEDSVDSIVTDPPYHLTTGKKGGSGPASVNIETPYGRARIGTGFMGMKWDGGDIAFRPEVWIECLRVLKPGGYCLSFGSTRTFHRMVSAIEDAGFEIRDTISWNFGSGFPKSRNVSADLLAMPACQCGGGAEISGDLLGVVHAIAPAIPQRATVGTEAASMPLAGFAAEANRVGPETGLVPFRRQAPVQSSVKDAQRHLDPVVFGAPSVTGSAQSCEIRGSVCGVEAQPKPLRDQMVGNESIPGSAVEAAPVTRDHIGGESLPLGSFVAPLTAAPSGVVGSAHSSDVPRGHTSARAIGSGPAADESIGFESNLTRETNVSGHNSDYPAESALKCERCGGVIHGRVLPGLGTALKPAMELICMARKPLIGTVAANVLAHGTGALNIDGCRVATEARRPLVVPDRRSGNGVYRDGLQGSRAIPGGTDAGRFPANLILSYPADEYRLRDDVTPDQLEELAGWLRANAAGNAMRIDDKTFKAMPANLRALFVAEPNPEREEVLAAFPQSNWQQAAVRPDSGTGNKTNGILGKFATNSNHEPRGDTGSAARFFYCAKASREDRNEGCEHMPKEPLNWSSGTQNPGSFQAEGTDRSAHNHHPTVKPTDLMRWLVRLVTPKGGIVLDPFMGSGSTGKAAMLEGMRFVGIELDAEYITIARARIDYAMRQGHQHSLIG